MCIRDRAKETDTSMKQINRWIREERLSFSPDSSYEMCIRDRFETLLGVTGSGKTFTMANFIAALNKPTLIISHNKTLAGQLYGCLLYTSPSGPRRQRFCPRTRKGRKVNDSIHRLTGLI